MSSFVIRSPELSPPLTGGVLPPPAARSPSLPDADSTRGNCRRSPFDASSAADVNDVREAEYRRAVEADTARQASGRQMPHTLPDPHETFAPAIDVRWQPGLMRKEGESDPPGSIDRAASPQTREHKAMPSHFHPSNVKDSVPRAEIRDRCQRGGEKDRCSPESTEVALAHESRGYGDHYSTTVQGIPVGDEASVTAAPSGGNPFVTPLLDLQPGESASSQRGGPCSPTSSRLDVLQTLLHSSVATRREPAVHGAHASYSSMPKAGREGTRFGTMSLSDDAQGNNELGGDGDARMIVESIGDDADVAGVEVLEHLLQNDTATIASSRCSVNSNVDMLRTSSSVTDGWSSPVPDTYDRPLGIARTQMITSDRCAKAKEDCPSSGQYVNDTVDTDRILNEHHPIPDNISLSSTSRRLLPRSATQAQISLADARYAHEARVSYSEETFQSAGQSNALGDVDEKQQDDHMSDGDAEQDHVPSDHESNRSFCVKREIFDGLLKEASSPGIVGASCDEGFITDRHKEGGCVDDEGKLEDLKVR